MLIGSHFRATGMGIVTQRGGGLFVHTAQNNLMRGGRVHNRVLAGGGVWAGGKSAVPAGYSMHGIRLPMKTGSLGMTRRALGSSSVTANGVSGLVASMLAQGTGTLVSASGSLVVSASALIQGSGGMTNAALRAYLNAVATIQGSGSMTGTLKGKGYARATILGTSADDMTLKATGKMVALVTPFTELSPQNLAQAVWGALSSGFDDLTTMGGQARFMYLLAHHKVVTDPAAGTITVYAEDGSTVLYVADLYENTSGSQAYRGQGADRRDAFL